MNAAQDPRAPGPGRADDNGTQTHAGSLPTRDDEVLIAEAMALLPSLRHRLLALTRRIDVPPPWDHESLRNEWIRRHPRVGDPLDWAAYEDQRKRLIAARLRWLRAWIHRLADEDAPAALCLSGGGIRSATFSLGVVQGLAAQGVMGDFHYLSSVSGGGYLASLLSAWIRNEALLQQASAAGQSLAEYLSAGLGTREPIRMEGAAHRDARNEVLASLGKVGNAQVEEPRPVRRLRAFSSYLSPMRGISADFLTLLAIYARNLTLNWMVWIPALLCVLVIPRIYLACLQATAPSDDWRKAMAGLAWLLIVWTIAYMASDLPAPPEKRKRDGTGNDPAPGARPAGGSPPTAPPPAKRIEGPSPKYPDDMWQMVLPLFLAALLLTCLIGWEAKGATIRSVWLLWLPARVQLWLNHSALPTEWQVTLLGFLLGGLTQGAASLLGGLGLRKLRAREAGKRPADLWAFFAVMVAGGATGAGLYWLIRWLLTMSPRPEVHAWRLPAELGTPPQDLRLLALWAVPLLMTLFWLGVTVYAGWRRPAGLEDEREWWARAAARWMLPSAVWILGVGLVFYLPGQMLAMAKLQSGEQAAAFGAGTGLLGVLLAAIGFISKQGPAWRQKAETLAGKTGMRMADLLSIAFIVMLLAGLSYSVTAMMRLHEPYLQMQESRIAVDLQAPAFTRMICKGLKAQDPDTRFTLGTTCRPLDCGHADNPCAPWTDRAAHYYVASLLTLDDPGPLCMAMLVAAILALGTSWRIGVNAFSLHSLYGNRLVRAYLAASRRDEDRRPHWFTGFDPQDNLPIHETWPETGAAEDARPRLMHIVNVALNLVKASGSRLEWQDRKAAPFTISPLFSGSRTTGYIPSKVYLRTEHIDGISLGCAMTVSGAAASPNMGYHSSIPLALVMTLFNVRLGLWSPNPTRAKPTGWPQERAEPGLGLTTLFDEAMGNTSSDTAFVNLSDGGHFDNTGLYEMVRRRVRHIVVVDAGADPEYQYDDLLSTVRRIRVDMGIGIEFTTNMPGPLERKRSGAAVARARIRYDHADPQGRHGTLLLIKPALVHDDKDGPWLPLDVRRYAEESRRGTNRFPQQPTSDQFFDESQFESYRMLGLHTVLAAYGPKQGPQAPDSGTPPLGPLGFGAFAAAVGSIAVSPPPPQGPAAEGGQADAAQASALSKLIGGLSDNAQILAAGTLVSVVTVTGVSSIGPPAPPPTGPGTAPPVTGPVTSGDPSVQVNQANIALAEFVTQIRNASTSAVDFSIEVGSAASAASAASGAGRGPVGPPGPSGVVRLNQADIDKLTAAATNTAKAADSADTAASKAEKAAAAAAGAAQAMEGMAGNIADIKRGVTQMPPRSNVRGGEGARQ
ncbi:patatin-like phospholipase family protein [Mitsuaria sp. 7]|uniref:patatin-like phospholipase family protein n=1 Tax=Mitsuaria sp. 7 TaxID=1658665 RepID=UPI000833D749|nr:patatin-like phospholipase family protein [Mitsuaria sp. 7]